MAAGALWMSRRLAHPAMMAGTFGQLAAPQRLRDQRVGEQELGFRVIVETLPNLARLIRRTILWAKTNRIVLNPQ